jgi:nicotinamidase-related amidase
MNTNDEYTLVVIDMQPLFTADNITISNVAREVRLARQRQNKIIFLWIPYFSAFQADLFAGTYPSILKAVQGYERAHWNETTKLIQDGSREILQTCARKDFPSKRFRLCGVNTDMCVLDTVKGLLAVNTPRIEAIEVVKDACRTSNSKTDNTKVWQLFPLDPRLSIIESEGEVLEIADATRQKRRA